MCYPHFLVIGAQKAGTTWLDRNLRTHPQIWLPPEKEIHFFDLPLPFPFAALQYAPGHAARHWARHRLQRDLAKVERGEQTPDWYQKYYYSLRSWRWYRSLFTPARGQIAGEATPRYAVIPRRKIAAICRRMPNLKIIYLLRDPIDRMWSDLAMFHDRRFGGEGTHQVIEAADSVFLKKSRNLQHSRYADNLRRWEEYFPRDQIFTGFLDEIASSPSTLLQRIFSFLGVDQNHSPAEELMSGKINFADYPAVPENVAGQLAQSLIDDTKTLTERLAGSPATIWRQRMETLLGADRSPESEIHA
jgi:hypothetical protein